MLETAGKAQELLKAIKGWEYWGIVQQGAMKEYGVTEAQFQTALPEYQKFMGLLALGYQGLGMFSQEVDGIWHSFILNTQLYEAFCMQFCGRFIHHIPNLECNTASDCNTPEQVCSSICKGSCKTPVPPEKRRPATSSDASSFREAYVHVYGELPGDMWHLPIADGMAA